MTDQLDWFQHSDRDLAVLGGPGARSEGIGRGSSSLALQPQPASGSHLIGHKFLFIPNVESDA
jgi:hypothetical protein